MAVLEIIIKLAGVAALSRYLYVKHSGREDRQFRPRDPAKWTGKAIDATKLTPSVANVRRNYLVARKSMKRIFFRRSLLGLARRSVARLAYFRGREAEDHSQLHGTKAAPFNGAL